MKNFTCCYVNTSRGDVTLNDVYCVQGDSLQKVIEDQMYEFQCDDEDYSFFTGFTVGEENCVVIFDENSQWFEKIKSFKQWSDDTYNAFVEFVYDEQATYA